MNKMPDLETKRLIIRSFIREDFSSCHIACSMLNCADADLGTDPMYSLAERAEWLEWAMRNDVQLAKLSQPTLRRSRHHFSSPTDS